MEAIKLTPETVDEIIEILTKTMEGKIYWSSVGFGEIKSVEDCPDIDWFRGRGVFERIFTTSICKTKKNGFLKFVYNHKGSTLIPAEEVFPFCYDTYVSVVGNDVFLFQKNNIYISKRGGTDIFMEWTEERHNKYKNKFSD